MPDIKVGSPIWNRQCIEGKIVGDTSRSWLVEWSNLDPRWNEPGKVPKKLKIDEYNGPQYFFSKEECDNQRYLDMNRYPLSQFIEKSRTISAANLRKIAELAGYDPQLHNPRIHQR